MDSDLPSSPQSSEAGREDTPLNLINALAACVLSAKLSPLYKQWAVKEFIQVWFKISTMSDFDITCIIEPYWWLPKQLNFASFIVKFLQTYISPKTSKNCTCTDTLIYTYLRYM